MKLTFEADFPNFEQWEFACKDGCGRNIVDGRILYMLQFVRNRYKKPVVVTSATRCAKYNASLPGSIVSSDHIKGKAVDFSIEGRTGTLEARKGIIRELSAFPGFKYGYCNGWILYADGREAVKKAPNMGNSIHISVK